jgi:uncharacterized membrane protein YkvA (DUF1232 family)
MFRLLAIRSVVFPFLKLVWRLLLDRRVPVFTKIIPLIAVAYVISPYDVIADRIPLLGQFDDVIVSGILFLLFIAASPGHVVADQTIGRKLRDLQRKQGIDPDAPGGDGPDGKVVDAEIRYIDDEEDENSGTNNEDK